MKPVTIVLVLGFLLAAGCAHSPMVIGWENLEAINRNQMPLNGYYCNHLGSDANHHHIETGIATGGREYLVPRTDAKHRIMGEYPYSGQTKRAEPLFQHQSPDSVEPLPSSEEQLRQLRKAWVEPVLNKP